MSILHKIKKKMAGSDLKKALISALTTTNTIVKPKDMETIAEYTQNTKELKIIMKKIWERMSQKKKKKGWKKILKVRSSHHRIYLKISKAMKLCEYLLVNGSWFFINELKDNSYNIRKFTNFLVFEGDEEKGQQIRNVSKKILKLLRNKDELKQQREMSKKIKRNLGREGGDGMYSSKSGSRGVDHFGAYSSKDDVNRDYHLGGYDTVKHKKAAFSFAKYKTKKKKKDKTDDEDDDNEEEKSMEGLNTSDEDAEEGPQRKKKKSGKMKKLKRKGKGKTEQSGTTEQESTSKETKQSKVQDDGEDEFDLFDTGGDQQAQNQTSNNTKQQESDDDDSLFGDDDDQDGGNDDDDLFADDGPSVTTQPKSQQPTQTNDDDDLFGGFSSPQQAPVQNQVRNNQGFTGQPTQSQDLFDDFSGFQQAQSKPQKQHRPTQMNQVLRPQPTNQPSPPKKKVTMHGGPSRAQAKKAPKTKEEELVDLDNLFDMPQKNNSKTSSPSKVGGYQQGFGGFGGQGLSGMGGPNMQGNYNMAQQGGDRYNFLDSNKMTTQAQRNMGYGGQQQNFGNFQNQQQMMMRGNQMGGLYNMQGQGARQGMGQNMMGGMRMNQNPYGQQMGMSYQTNSNNMYSNMSGTNVNQPQKQQQLDLPGIDDDFF